MKLCTTKDIKTFHMRKKFHQKHLLLGLTAGLDSWDCPFQLFTENKSKLLMHGFEPQILGVGSCHSANGDTTIVLLKQESKHVMQTAAPMLLSS